VVALMTDNKRVLVKDVMKPNYGTINRNATIAEALKEMKRLQTAVLVVEKRDEDDEYGLLLVSDIARKVLAKDKSSSRVNTYEIMAKPAVCVDPDMDIRYCSRLMARFNLMRVLVVKDGSILGTVSPRALVLDGLAEIEAHDGR
jgi:predicted transcriptional regulator